MSLKALTPEHHQVPTSPDIMIKATLPLVHGLFDLPVAALDRLMLIDCALWRGAERSRAFMH
jgi:hypothetical protein